MNHPSIILIASTCLCLLGCSDTQLTAAELEEVNVQSAKKGGKPGPPEPTPPGFIYAYVDGDRVEMDGDGTVLRILDPAAKGSPTYEMHGGERWFVNLAGVPGVYPDSTQRQEVFAVSESGTAVQLTNDPLFHPMRQPRWSTAPADGKLAFSGRRFSSPAAAADEGGIYLADVAWPTPSMSALVLHVAGVVTEDVSRCTTEGVCFAEPDLYDVGWASDGTSLLYTKLDLPESPSGLETRTSIYKYVGGSSSLVVSPGQSPTWSSQDAILFTDHTVTRKGFTNRLWAFDLGTHDLTLVEEIHDNTKGANRDNHTFARFRGHDWSRDGDHFVYAIQECRLSEPPCDSRIIRRKADGAGETLLASPETGVYAWGWR